jgi:hypothetical protein
MMATDNGRPITSQVEFDPYREQHASTRDRVRDLFYQMCATLQTNNQTTWLALSPNYALQENFLWALKPPESIHLVATKDLVSVQIILESRYFFLYNENTFQVTRTLRELKSLQNITRTAMLDPIKIHFLDDHPPTVK